MPGRGRPWKGVGEGNPDRIGTAAIADGSITEADLDSSVTSKLNSASGHVIKDEGGVALPQRVNLDFVGAGVTASDGVEDTTTVTIAGGGGGTQFPDGVPFTRGLLYDDFAWFNPQAGTTAFEEKYEVLLSGTIQSQNAFLGAPTIEGTAVDGQGKAIISGDNWEINQNKNSETQLRIALVQTTNIIAIAGLHDGAVVNESATIATAESGLNTGAWFRYSAGDSANWQAVTKDAASTNVIDTGVAATTSFINMEIRLDGTTATFLLNGSQVAQTTLNYPDDVQRISTTVLNQGGTFRAVHVDAWHCLADK